MHSRIFYEFKPKMSVSDGRSIYDFLGTAIDATYKKGWERNIVPAGQAVTPGYPAVSEWTVDWLACLLAARFAGERFTAIELGAGYGQWMVASIYAYKSLHPHAPAHGMALEAEQTHYAWLESHVEKNLGCWRDVKIDAVLAAAGYDGIVNFPVIDAPASNYGAAYLPTASGAAVREVECLSMQTIDQRFDEARVDLLHVDIQGAEADLIKGPGFSEMLKKVRVALFGTHRSEALHQEVKQEILDAGLELLIEWPRNSELNTPFGRLRTNDGAILAVSPEDWSRASEEIVPRK